jgi:hypothetical protein
VCPADGYHVKPTRSFLVTVLQVVSRCADEALLLAVVHRVRTIAEFSATSETYLDEYQLVAVCHHQIDLACPNAIIAFEGA